MTFKAVADVLGAQSAMSLDTALASSYALPSGAMRGMPELTSEFTSSSLSNWNIGKPLGICAILIGRYVSPASMMSRWGLRLNGEWKWPMP